MAGFATDAAIRGKIWIFEEYPANFRQIVIDFSSVRNWKDFDIRGRELTGFMRVVCVRIRVRRISRVMVFVFKGRVRILRCTIINQYSDRNTNNSYAYSSQIGCLHSSVPSKFNPLNQFRIRLNYPLFTLRIIRVLL